LFLPASKSLTPPPPPTGLPHLQCYKLVNVTGNKTGSGITVVDQFGSRVVDLSPNGPWRLCVPVDKNGEDPCEAGEGNHGGFSIREPRKPRTPSDNRMPEASQTVGGPSNRDERRPLRRCYLLAAYASMRICVVSEN
jgi:hypothetical protein